MRSVWIVTSVGEDLVIAVAASRDLAQREADGDQDLWENPLVWRPDSDPAGPDDLVDTTNTYRIRQHRVIGRWQR